MTTKKIFIAMVLGFFMLILVGCKLKPSVELDDYQKIFNHLSIGFVEGDSDSHVTGNLTLPTEVTIDVEFDSISWMSSHPQIIQSNGELNRPAIDTQVMVALIVTIDGVSKDRVTSLTVIGDSSNVPSTYTIVFDSNGGSLVASAFVEEGLFVDQPTNPIRAGYNFIEWRKDGVLYSFNEPVTSNMTLVAYWEPIVVVTNYTVTFNSNGGSSVINRSVPEGETLTAPSNPTRNGDAFAGWYKDFELTIPWNFSVDVVTSNTTLYAKWTLGTDPLLNGRTLTFQDEFDDEELDLSKWSYQNGTGAEFGIPFWGNSEKQYYKTENVEVSNGSLKLHAKMEQTYDSIAKTTMYFSSGKIVTQGKFDQTFGRFEAKIKAPLGQGFWPAFWLLPVNNTYGNGWPYNGEIDIVELRGRVDNKVTSAIHFHNGSGHQYQYGETTIPNSGKINQFHVYAVEWVNNKLEFSVDGYIYHTRQGSWHNAPHPFDQDFYIILNLAVGGHFDNHLIPGVEDFPASLEIDYVRVYA